MTNPAPPNITKPCSHCGKQKPLSAFLEMSGTQGTVYGNICSTCRKTTLEDAERRKKTEAEGSTTSETGHKIDAKSKIHDDIDRREAKERVEEEYHAERKIEEESSHEKNEVEHKTEAGQKKHRDEFLKNPPFLSGKRTEVSRDPKFTKTAEAAKSVETGNKKALSATHEKKEEQKRTQHDFTVANQGEQITGQIRFSSQAFQQFRQRLGTTAPIAKNLNQTSKESTATKKIAGTFAETLREKEEKDPAVEFIENNWRPGSKR